MIIMRRAGLTDRRALDVNTLELQHHLHACRLRDDPNWLREAE
eukprot:COSAG01_NODE_31419_length_598_cov_0.645291_1_plen_42_part_10